MSSLETEMSVTTEIAENPRSGKIQAVTSTWAAGDFPPASPHQERF